MRPAVPDLPPEIWIEAEPDSDTAKALDELVRESEELGLYQAWKLAEETEVTSEIPVAYLRHLIESSRPPKE